jgi:hypothetical protein
VNSANCAVSLYLDCSSHILDDPAILVFHLDDKRAIFSIVFQLTIRNDYDTVQLPFEIQGEVSQIDASGLN